MTDNEIIKPLEWYASKFKTLGFVYTDADGTKLISTQDVLELINRQKAEIEKLNAQVEQCYNDSLEESIMFKKILSNKKSETIKEFAEKVKQNFADFEFEVSKRKTYTAGEVKVFTDSIFHLLIPEQIDELVTEMMEAETNEQI